METRIAIIGIVVEDSSMSGKVNELLHRCGQYIIGRTGIPYREAGVNIITVALDAPQNVINSLAGEIGRIQGISAKTIYSNVIRKQQELKQDTERSGQVSSDDRKEKRGRV